MPNRITTYSNITDDQVTLIKSHIAIGATDNELKLFLHVADKSGLDPLSRQIYFIKRSGKMTIQTGIDGFRAVADRTGQYVGSSDAVFEESGNKPTKATVTVNKVVQGVIGNFTATARWSEYYPGKSQGFMWDKMPHTMLGKCAEALALRKAFPAQLSGLYTGDEMDQAGKEGIPNESKNINVKGGSKQLEESLTVPAKSSSKGSKVEAIAEAITPIVVDMTPKPISADISAIAFQDAENELDEAFAFCPDKEIHDRIIKLLDEAKYDESKEAMDLLFAFASTHPENMSKFQDVAKTNNKKWQETMSKEAYTQLYTWMGTLNNFFSVKEMEVV